MGNGVRPALFDPRRIRQTEMEGTTMKTIKKRIEADSYLAMIRRFPQRPIRNDAECERATKILDEFFPGGDLDPGTADYVQVLAGLVADYEEKQHAIDTSRVTPVELLKH